MSGAARPAPARLARPRVAAAWPSRLRRAGSAVALALAVTLVCAITLGLAPSGGAGWPVAAAHR